MRSPLLLDLRIGVRDEVTSTLTYIRVRVTRLPFGSFRHIGVKLRNAAHRGPQRRTVAHPRGFRVYMTDPLCDTHRFDLQRAFLVGLWCPEGGNFGGGGR